MTSESPVRREDRVVRISKIDGGIYLIRHGSSIQRRTREGIRQDIIDILKHKPHILVEARLGRGGRWELGRVIS